MCKATEMITSFYYQKKNINFLLEGFVFLSNKKAVVSIQNQNIWCQNKINISEGFLWNKHFT